MRPRALVYFYRRRLRVHAAQELFAGVGVAIAVALVFAVTVANESVAGSASAVVRAVTGPATLQLRSRGPDGFDQRPLEEVEHLPDVKQAAALLEVTGTVVAPNGRRDTVDVAGSEPSLALLDGLAETLPIGALSPGGVGLSKASANVLGIPARSHGNPVVVSLEMRGQSHPLKVSAVLGGEAAGALAQAQIAVMPLKRLQALTGLQGRITRILVQAKPGREAAARRELETVAAGQLTVAGADQDISLLGQALRPSGQASALFAGLSALLGFLFAFNAMLLTVPERRAAIADLRLDGSNRAAIVQMVVFEALCLGAGASILGVLGGYALSTDVFHQSPTYLTKAFTLGTSTIIGPLPVVLSLGGGVLATCLASLVPLQDLRKGRALDAPLRENVAGTAAAHGAHRWLLGVTVALLALASGLFVLVPSAALAACVLLAVATMLAVPVVLSAVLRLAEAFAARNERFTALPLALSSLKATALRSLALAATGAVALFGSVALGSSRSDLLRGIDGYTAHYASSADVWVVNPEDNQAVEDFNPDSYVKRLSHVAGVASVHVFQSSFLDFGNRRTWVIAWPAGVPMELLHDQIVKGNLTGTAAAIREGNSIAVSEQIASEYHVGVGDTLTLPTPSGEESFKVAATTTNFGWTPGAILMSTGAYERYWASQAPSALGVDLVPTANASVVKSAIEHELGAGSGLEVLSAQVRKTTIEKTASEGLGQLGEIAMLLVIAAILAMAAALGSSIWQRRASLAELRLEGAQRRHLQVVLLLESVLMLSAGCITGAAAGIYGQAIIDGYLTHVTGFPVAGVTTGQQPIEIFAVVIVAVLVIVSLPGWIASRVPPALALEE